MADDPFPQHVPSLAGFIRVQRGVETAQDFIAAFPALEEAALASEASGAGPELSDQDRRRLLDYPDAEEEAANIRRLSSRTRADLLLTAVSYSAELTNAEVELLANGFWADVTTEENGRKVHGVLDTARPVQGRVDRAQNAAAKSLGIERIVYGKALYEQDQRRRRLEDEKGAAQLARRLHPTPTWMSDLARQCREDLRHRWGFIALYDAEALETTSADVQNRFETKVEEILFSTMAQNGAQQHGILSRWRLHFVDPPRPDASAADYGTTMRNAFHAFLDSEVWRQSLQWERGVRTDVFFVVNKECMDSVLGGDDVLDDMRMAAYEADFTPADGASHDDGYEGWTWVRLQQLVYRFYGAACTREDITMHDIWRAAQVSKHNAFVSLDPEVARGWTARSSFLGQSEPRYDAHF